VNRRIQSFKNKWKHIQERVQNFPIFQSAFVRKAIAIIRGMIRQTGEHEIAFRSAALAYYGLLSLFPLLLFLVFLGSQFLESKQAQTALNKSITEFIPAASGTVQQVINQTLSARGSIGLIGGIGLLWTASTLFNQLTTSLLRSCLSFLSP
jgi:membrane protein